jgi:hypothetical protein
MCINIHASSLAHYDLDASAAFDRDPLGREVCSDVMYGGRRQTTADLPEQTGTPIVVELRAPDPSVEPTSAAPPRLTVRL